MDESNEDFKEANEKRIVLPGKNPDEMLQFLKFLYDLKVRKKCVSHVARYVKMDGLEKSYHKLEAQLIQELLVAKCRHLEWCLEKHEEAAAHLFTSFSTDESSTSSSSED